MNNLDLFKTIINKNKFTQAGNAMPLFGLSSSLSAFEMKKQIGVAYSCILCHFKKEYGEISYLDADLKRIWSILKSRWIKNPLYFYQIKKNYKKNLTRLDKKDFSKMADKDLLSYFKKIVKIQSGSMGSAHCIEAANLGVDEDFKLLLSDYIKDKKEFNYYYTILTTPTKLSFSTKEELDLFKLKKLVGNRREREIEKHLEKYKWVLGSYIGVINLTKKILEERLKNLSKKPISQKDISKIKDKLSKKLNLNSKIKKYYNLIDFLACWQDERKVNILKSIYYFDKLIEEIALRKNINKENLKYLCPSDVYHLKVLEDLQKMEKELEKRSEGCYILQNKEKEVVAFGKSYQILRKIDKKISTENNKKEDQFYGTPANTGTAVGQVVICNGVKDLPKMKEGNILVSSMTRPEYMPAIRKALAIVTDEGGITCHAAIVAREFGIPCIIGTKKATKILQDGMQVEVRANHGYVRILK